MQGMSAGDMGLHVRHEPIKKISAVIRARSGLWVVLHCEHRFVLHPETRHAAIIQVYMGHLDSVIRLGIGTAHYKTVVLGSDFIMTRGKVFYRVVDPRCPWCIFSVAMPKLSAKSWCPKQFQSPVTLRSPPP